MHNSLKINEANQFKVKASVKCVQVEVVLRTSFDVFSNCKKTVHGEEAV